MAEVSRQLLGHELTHKPDVYLWRSSHASCLWYFPAVVNRAVRGLLYANCFVAIPQAVWQLPLTETVSCRKRCCSRCWVSNDCCKLPCCVSRLRALSVTVCVKDNKRSLSNARTMSVSDGDNDSYKSGNASVESEDRKLRRGSVLIAGMPLLCCALL